MAFVGYYHGTTCVFCRRFCGRKILLLAILLQSAVNDVAGATEFTCLVSDAPLPMAALRAPARSAPDEIAEYADAD